MPVLVAAVVLVGALCLLDLLLTLGVVRRLREHTQHLETLLASGSGVSVGTGMLPIGDTARDFAGTTVGGEPVSRGLLAGETLVAFFSPGCEPCREKLPAFVEYARTLDDGPQRILAVVTGQGDDTHEMIEALTPVARVVVDGHEEQIVQAFQVTVFPAFCLVDAEGTLIDGDVDFARLPVPIGS